MNFLFHKLKANIKFMLKSPFDSCAIAPNVGCKFYYNLIAFVLHIF